MSLGFGCVRGSENGDREGDAGGPALLVQVLRNGTRESLHRVNAVAVDTGGRVVWSAGPVDESTFWRSGAKPVQAVPFVESGAPDRFGLSEKEIAIAAGSHTGTPAHVDTVLSILAKAGLSPELLHCGAGEPSARLAHNCSGKHSAMLLLASHMGWRLEGYWTCGHPVQQAVLECIRELTGLPAGPMVHGTDGCGIVTARVPLRGMARAFALLASSTEAPGAGLLPVERTAAMARIVRAMWAFPEMVAGEGRLDTELMRLSKGSLVCKAGAEGVWCAGLSGRGLGLALKVEDGSGRAVDPAALECLRIFEAVPEGVLEDLGRFRRPEVTNSLGEVVGHLRVV